MGAAVVLTRLLPLLVTAAAVAGAGPGARLASTAPPSAAPSAATPALPNEKEDVHILQANAHTFIGNFRFYFNVFFIIFLQVPSDFVIVLLIDLLLFWPRKEFQGIFKNHDVVLWLRFLLRG